MSKARQLAQKPSQSTGRKNLIINGAMQVAQRGTSVTGTNDIAEVHTVDRFYTETTGATYDVDQVSDAPDGFSNSMRVTTAAFTPTASQYLIPFEQRIEGQNFSHLAYGTSAAKTVTLSFWIKSNKTGTYVVEFSNIHAPSYKRWSQSYTIDAANTWERKTLTWTGDTASGAEFDDDNTFGAAFIWWMTAGTTFTSGALSGAWETSTNANRAVGVPSSLAAGDVFYLTGVQLEVGSTATEFEHRSYAEELALCQRYYCQFPHDITADFTAFPMWAYFSGGASTRVLLPVTMRASPSVTLDGTITTGTPNVSDIGVYSNGGWVNGSGQSVTFNEAEQSSVRLTYTKSSAFTSGHSAGFYIYNNGTETNRIQIDAEL